LLAENGFLIKREVNELELLKQNYFLSRISGKNLQLTIAPTLNCNFACPYCYHETNQNQIDKKTEKSIIHLVSKKLLDNGNLYVTWFGGEPLLRWEQIKKLSANLQKICNTNLTLYCRIYFVS
jgi:uncharacterized protein